MRTSIFPRPARHALVALTAGAVFVFAVRAGTNQRPSDSRATLADHLESAPAAGSTAIACHTDEPGERLLLDIEVVDAAGRPATGVTIVAYNTDAAGLYNPRDSLTSVPRIRATVVSDARGRCQVLTVRPAAYPDASDPAHIHFEALSAPGNTSYRTVWFEGDPLITDAKRAWADRDEETEIVRINSRRAGTPVCPVRVVLKPD